MFKKLFYLIFLVSLLAVVADVQADVIFSDDFDHAMMDDWSRINYQGWYEQNILGWPSPGGPWVIGNWDGYQSLPDDTGVSPTLIAQPYIDATGNVQWGDPDDPNAPQTWRPGYEGPVLNGVLRISSTNSAWEHDRNSGPFLYKMVEGDFIATVEVVAYDVFWHNLGSIMARVPNEGGAGADELWTQVNFFPLYGIGNRVMDKSGPGSSSAPGVKGYPAHRFLKLQREGNTFSYYTSPDGVTYSSLMTSDPDDPNSMIPLTIVRDDFPAEIQVGITQSNFTGDWLATMDFDNFSIETVTEPVAVGPVHLYTFEDGTAKDEIDGADGTLIGGAAIVDGAMVTTAQDQWMEMPGDVIAMNTYDAVTVEAWYIPTAGANTSWTMLAYFGDSTDPDPSAGLGNDGFFITSARGDNVSRAAISIGNSSAPYSSESGANGTEYDDGLLHHMVATIDATNITLYIDGVLQASTALSAENQISGISQNYALLAKGGYGSDPEWIGAIEQFAIYNVALTADEIAANFAAGPSQ